MRKLIIVAVFIGITTGTFLGFAIRANRVHARTTLPYQCTVGCGGLNSASIVPIPDGVQGNGNGVFSASLNLECGSGSSGRGCPYTVVSILYQQVIKNGAYNLELIGHSTDCSMIYSSLDCGSDYPDYQTEDIFIPGAIAGNSYFWYIYVYKYDCLDYQDQPTIAEYGGVINVQK